MFSLFLIVSVFSVGYCIVCTPELCANAVQEQLNCPGSVIKHGGFCGCTDVCAKQENEECQAHYGFGIIPAGRCDDGLTCVQDSNGPPMVFGRGKCVKTEHADHRRALPETLTACQQMLRVRMISMVVWRGMWTPKCDSEGNFQPQQCDNIGRCFCVDEKTGAVDKSTMVQGTATCGVSKRSTMTKCQQKYYKMQFSLAIWQGMWYPKCDTNGNFQPEQCDNTGHCFCVSAIDGVVDDQTKVLGSANCATKKREMQKLTKCQQIRQIRLISFVVWKGQWTPKCDALGKFMPEQCDNTGHCFCVSALEGTVDESTKVLGSADCSNSMNSLTPQSS